MVAQKGRGVKLRRRPGKLAPHWRAPYPSWPMGLRRAFGLGIAVLPAGFAILFGCAGPSEERHLDAMREEIDTIQKDRDRANDIPTEPAVAGSGARAVPAAGPVLGAVTLGVGEDQESEDAPAADDPAPRPAIRVFGAARQNGGRWRGDDQVEQTFPAASEGASSGASPPSALDPEAKRAYDAALSLVTARQYDKALDSLAAFLLKWPDHPYADNAMYWRGECYFARGDYVHASEQFEGVLARFPAGNKAPDALLKLGICRQKLGDPNGARELFVRLTQQYPKSEASRRIPTVTVPAATPSGSAAEDHR
jgi:tol-pal system protein YbgF